MQAGRAQPPTRWANPHRKPAIHSIAARDSETGLRGQPARASGAAKPAKTNQRRLPPLACAASARFTCAASSSFLAMVGTAPRPPPPPPCRRRGPLLSFLAGAAPPRLHPRGQGKGREGVQAEIEKRVRPWRRRLARRRPLVCCCHQPPVNQLLSALRSHLFFPLVVILSPNPLHKNKEESVQVVAAMVCTKCKISLPPPGLDDSHAEFSIPLIFLFIHKRILFNLG